jgi:hypothetical protein
MDAAINWKLNAQNAEKRIHQPADFVINVEMTSP